MVEGFHPRVAAIYVKLAGWLEGLLNNDGFGYGRFSGSLGGGENVVKVKVTVRAHLFLEPVGHIGYGWRLNNLVNERLLFGRFQFGRLRRSRRHF